MSIRETQRELVVARLCEHLLQHGLALTSLRQLAAAAQVSDRMLLYYFTDKTEILSQTLKRIAEGLVAGLNAALPAEPMPAHILMNNALQLVRSPEVQPSMRLWLEIVAAAARNEEPFPIIAAGILDQFLVWLDRRLDIADQTKRREAAALILATIDGIALFDLVGRIELANAAQNGIEVSENK